MESGKELREIDSSQSLLLLNEAIELDPENALAFFERGETHNAMGMNDEAEADYGKFLELGSANQDLLKTARSRKLEFNFRRGAYAECLEDLSKFIQKDVRAYPAEAATIAVASLTICFTLFLVLTLQPPQALRPGPKFRPDHEAEKAIRGFARSVTDLLIEKEDLTPGQKESFLALTLEKAEELFSKVVGVEVGEDLNRKVEQILSGVTENEEMREILLDQLKSVQEHKRVQTLLLPSGVSIEKNFIYDQALPQNVMHRRLDPEKLTWAFGIFGDEVKKSLVKIHQEVERDEVVEVLSGLVEKVSTTKKLSNPSPTSEQSLGG